MLRKHTIATQQYATGAFDQGLAHLKNGEYKEAAADFALINDKSKSLFVAFFDILKKQRKVTRAGFHHYLGLVQIGLGNPAEAIQSFKTATEYDESFLPAQLCLALTEDQLTLTRAELHYHLGLAQIGLGNPAEAIQSFTTATKHDKSFFPAQLCLALTYAFLDERRQTSDKNAAYPPNTFAANEQLNNARAQIESTVHPRKLYILCLIDIFFAVAQSDSKYQYPHEALEAGVLAITLHNESKEEQRVEDASRLQTLFMQQLKSKEEHDIAPRESKVSAEKHIKTLGFVMGLIHTTSTEKALEKAEQLVLSGDKNILKALKKDVVQKLTSLPASKLNKKSAPDLSALKDSLLNLMTSADIDRDTQVAALASTLSRDTFFGSILHIQRERLGRAPSIRGGRLKTAVDKLNERLKQDTDKPVEPKQTARILYKNKPSQKPTRPIELSQAILTTLQNSPHREAILQNKEWAALHPHLARPKHEPIRGVTFYGQASEHVHQSSSIQGSSARALNRRPPHQ